MYARFKRSIVFHIICFLLAIAVLRGAYEMVRQARSLRQESNDTQAKIYRLLQKKQELETNLSTLRAPEVIEREAKERLNLKRPGEEVIVVLPSKSTTTIPSPSRWDRIRMYLKQFLP